MRRIAGFTLVELIVTTAFAMARIAAITRRTPVAVCPTENGRDCADTIRWEGGWLVFEDRRRLGRPERPQVILAASDAVDRVSIRSTDGRRLVRYQPDGRSPGSNVTLSICSLRTGQLVSRTVVNNVGRVRTERGRGSSCGT